MYHTQYLEFSTEPFFALNNSFPSVDFGIVCTVYIVLVKQHFGQDVADPALSQLAPHYDLHFLHC